MRCEGRCGILAAVLATAGYLITRKSLSLGVSGWPGQPSFTYDY